VFVSELGDSLAYEHYYFYFEKEKGRYVCKGRFEEMYKAGIEPEEESLKRKGTPMWGIPMWPVPSEYRQMNVEELLKKLKGERHERIYAIQALEKYPSVKVLDSLVAVVGDKWQDDMVVFVARCTIQHLSAVMFNDPLSNFNRVNAKVIREKIPAWWKEKRATLKK